MLLWWTTLSTTTTTQSLSCCDGEEEEGVSVALLCKAVGGSDGEDEADAALGYSFCCR